MIKKIKKIGEKIEKSERIKKVREEMSNFAKKVSINDVFGLNYFYYKLITNK